MDNFLLTRITPTIRHELSNSSRSFILLDVKPNCFKAIFYNTQSTEFSQNFSNSEYIQSIHNKYRIAALYALRYFHYLVEPDTIILID